MPLLAVLHPNETYRPTRQQGQERSYLPFLRALFIRKRTYNAMMTASSTLQSLPKPRPSNTRQGSTNTYFFERFKNRTLTKCRSVGHFAYTLHSDRHDCRLKTTPVFMTPKTHIASESAPRPSEHPATPIINRGKNLQVIIGGRTALMRYSGATDFHDLKTPVVPRGRGTRKRGRLLSEGGAAVEIGGK
ncbi:hypothetical protein TcasGA2_TC003863 [Tribolium castaneum]|uniref:Uncharacterized protein n=1 Tax=Tribolium castaneum TaxID=7070 RepID=D6WFY8_TRICA|nr:hypothetical protein TcasGA2_TC003863 [Tribolium castaneum]